MRTKSPQIGWIVAGTALILAVPAVAMQFTDEVNWGPADFIIAAAMLLSAGFAYEWLRPRLGYPGRLITGATLLTVLALVWAQLAVGILE